jgi:dTDP-4-dehydrorhamnose reductase
MGDCIVLLNLAEALNLFELKHPYSVKGHDHEKGSTMKILVLGAGGMMGHMACRVLGARHEVTGATRGAPGAAGPLTRHLPLDHWLGGVDVHRWETVEEALLRVRPEVVLNCVGVVKQIEAARQPIVSIEINALLPHRLALACALAGARLIHLSTDCVFSGRRGMYTEDDTPDPVDLYGRSKLLGETGEHGALTLRTSIVGRQLAGQTGLFEWFIARRGGAAKGYARAIYTGLTTRALCGVIGRVLELHPALEGVWQVASAPIAKYDLLAALNRRLGLGIALERDESFACDRSLDGSKFTQRTGIAIPSWDEMLDEFVADNIHYA